MNDKLKCPGQNIKDLEAKPGLLVWELTNLWQRHINNTLQEFDLTHVQFFLLKGIKILSETNEIITQADIANFLNMHVMMISKVIRSLEDKNYVARFSHPTDTRANCLKLTSLGEETYLKSSKIVKKLSKKFFGKDLPDYDKFIEILKNLIEKNQI